MSAWRSVDDMRRHPRPSHPAEASNPETEIKMTPAQPRLLALGAAALLTRGSDMGLLPEPDFGLWRPLA
jgi:hypothetical protein